MFSWFRRREATGQRPSGEGRQPRARRGAVLHLQDLESRTLPATFVDANNTTGVEDGTALRPYTTVQAAVTAAPANEVISVAQGTYAENVVIPDVSLQLLGGFAGGTAAAYTANQPGDFAVSDPVARPTRITAASDLAPVVLMEPITAKTIVIDGFVISGGLHGIYVIGDFQQFPNVTISRNIIENNGPAALQADGGTYSYNGGGIHASNATVTITNNILRNNNANRGGGLAIFSRSAFTVTDNLIENNSGYGDHGGGVWLTPLPQAAAGSGTFSRNVIRGNVASKAFNYGWGGGMLISGNDNPSSLKPLTLSNNVWTGNSAPSIGGAIFVDDGATVVLDRELIYKNTTTTAGGGAIFLNGTSNGVGSFLTIQNSTIADNTSGVQEGNGVNVQEFCKLTVSNSIFWGNTDDFIKDDSSTITVRFTDSQEAMPGIGNLSTDPLFANAAAGDYHLQSTVGRFDPTANGGAGGFVQDGVHSPAIDAGDPASPFANETVPNGGRVNLGFDGNTPQASQSGLTGGGPVNLVVDGTSGNDVISIVLDANRTNAIVKFRSVVTGTFPLASITGRIIVNGLQGNDRITLAPTITIGADLFGGAGNDTVTGGSGNDVLNGEGDNDVLKGGKGDDRFPFVGDWGVDRVSEVLNGGTDLLDFSAITSSIAFLIPGSPLATVGVNRVTGGGNTERLLGGSANDSFAFAAGGRYRGALDGGPGTNTLDYTRYASAVTVNLPLATATGTNGISNFIHVIGGAASDLLVGDSQVNQLTGNGGRDILIGGDGADVLSGGAKDDLLFGGSTVHDGDAVALAGIKREWVRATSYTNRVGHLFGTLPGGLNGAALLDAASLQDDGGDLDGLTGGLDTDWFITFAGDNAIDPTTGETLTVL